MIMVFFCGPCLLPGYSVEHPRPDPPRHAMRSPGWARGAVQSADCVLYSPHWSEEAHGISQGVGPAVQYDAILAGRRREAGRTRPCLL